MKATFAKYLREETVRRCETMMQGIGKRNLTESNVILQAGMLDGVIMTGYAMGFLTLKEQMDWFEVTRMILEEGLEAVIN